MADSAGVRLDWSTISPDGNVAASVAGTHRDNSGFHAALRIAAGQPVDLEHSQWVTLLRQS